MLDAIKLKINPNMKNILSQTSKDNKDSIAETIARRKSNRDKNDESRMKEKLEAQQKASRKLINEKDVEEMKAKSGFQTLFVESSKICDKVARKAKMIISFEHTEHVKD